MVSRNTAPRNEPPGGPTGPAFHRFGISGVVASLIVLAVIIAVGIPQAILRFFTELAHAALR